ncbi:TetR/AcrR family transcriptional regulator [Amycolatopsis oliviviridis]|uniref:TetR family transcriptional regulator n=1 Tax=Amycolatopsis oliviviridis TaxID=1471590 RepID=A0ABQ3M8Z6_9PSEU|nr:TetR/AcrR family transcriptional regulator [Amycolatopsis oliviviridis]GHH34728.1 TetR family transcriptional regulator [Amycolatopsis oliviviridis]
MATRDGKGPDLQRSLALLWAGRTPGRRGPRAQLSVERIARAAIQVADAEGLDALSMQRVATELGYSTMSLYNHIASKDLLLEVMADVAAAEPPGLDDAADFRDAVHQWVEALWAGFRTRPWLLRVPLDHSPIGPNHLAWMDRLLRPLLKAGLAPGEARAAALHLTAVVRGTAQLSLDMDSAHKTAGGLPHTETEVSQALTELITPEDYPALAAVHAAEATVHSGHEETGKLPAELGFGVDRFLDGIDAWVSKRT